MIRIYFAGSCDDYSVFLRPILLYVASYYHAHGYTEVTSVVRATPHTKRGAYSIVNGDRCSASHCNYQNRIRSVRIFANCLSAVISFNSTILVTSAIRTALRLNNINVKKLLFKHELTANDTSKTAKITKR